MLSSRGALCTSRCLYHRHAIDPCQYYGCQGHNIQEKTVQVGHACARHMINQPYKAEPGIKAAVLTKEKSVVEDDKPDNRSSSSKPVIEDDIISRVEPLPIDTK